MPYNHSVRFFDEQFRRQLAEADFALNPFEQIALEHLHGDVLDYGCGLGNLAEAAARRGCSVTAVDASTTAVARLQQLARREGLPIQASEVDLREHCIAADYDTVVCIGLLHFFDCATAQRQLAQLQSHVRPGGIAIVNVLVEGTNFFDMFSPEGHCLFGRGQLHERFAGWELLNEAWHEFPAPSDTRKMFATVVARKPVVRAPAGLA